MDQSQESGLRIGAVARLAEVSVDTVRYYERRGLLSPADRLASGYRIYPRTTVSRIRLARRLQSLGLTLTDVAEALAAHDRGDAGCASQRWRLEAVQRRVEARLAELTAIRDDLDSVLAACADGRCELLTPEQP